MSGRYAVNMAAFAVLLACRGAPAPAGRRIVSLHDTTTEIVVGLGRADELVAVMEPEFLSPEALVAVEGLPRLPAPVSAEALAALQPTVVLGTEDVPAHQPELANWPNSLWIDPAGLDGLWTAIREVGAAIDAPTEPYLATLQARLPAEAPAGEPVPVFVYDCCEPPFTMGGRAPLTEILARIGGRNVFGDLDQDWAHVSWESVLAAHPALVVVDDYAAEGGAEAKLATVAERLGPVPTVVLPLALALEGPRTLEAPAVLAPALARVREGIAP